MCIHLMVVFSPQINWDETDFEKNRKFRFFSSKNQFFFRFFWKSQFFWKNYTFVVFSFKNDFNRFFEIYIMKNIKKTHFDASEIFWSQNVKKLFAIKKIKNWLFFKKKLTLITDFRKKPYSFLKNSILIERNTSCLL